MMPRAVIFDLDGTLYDNRCLHWLLPLTELCCLRLGYLARERKARKLMYGQNYGTEEMFYQHLFGAISSHNPVQASQWYHRHYMPLQARILRHCCHPYAWVKARLAELRDKGILVVLYSDYGFAAQKLQALGIDPSSFDLIVDAPSLGGLKPSRESAEKLLQMLQLQPEEVLFVGDRDDCDAETARRIGAPYRLITRP